MGAAWQWVRRHPVPVDVVAALVIGVLTVASLFEPVPYVDIDYREGDALGVLLSAASAAAIAFRSRFPVPAFAVATGTSLVVLALGYAQALGGVSALVTLYTVALATSLRTSLTATVSAWVALMVAFAVSPFPVGATDVAGNTLVLTTGWGVGRAVRTQRENVAGLEERNRALEAARESQLQAAMAEERSRIAREMHDVVAHSLTAMTVQATAARRVLRRDPDAAEQALDAVQAAGREALDELRRVLGVLRPGEAALHPQPGTSDLADLVDGVRAAGLDVVLEETPRPAAVDPGVDLAAYRIVQEALTNALKHAGPATVRVRLGWGDDRLDIAVEDDGRGAAVVPGTGRGLRLLAERASAYGGRVVAGPRRGGGYALHATLPVRSAG